MDDPFDLGEDAPPAAKKTTQHEANHVRTAAPAQIIDDICAELNPTQKQAVIAPDGPLLILAGAGTGKTRVLTTRIAYKLAAENATPWQILAVTFTNKAAQEMKTRIGQMVGGRIEQMPWLGTFHSIGARILRTHAETRNLNPNFTILDTDDQIRLLKQIIIAANIDEKKWQARLMAGLIDRWKNRAWTPDHIPENEAQSFANGRGGEIYRQYQARLKTLNAVDFGDLLLETFLLLQNNPEILAQYQNRFQHILVDEYQDTNIAQYLWLRLLAGAHQNICCVGDDDQSIYGWRGAEVNNILGFADDFQNAQIIRLEENYRSTPQILGAASGLIAHNQGRLGKTLWTHNPKGERIYLRAVWDDKEEARVIIDDIENHHRKKHALNKIAILVRTSGQMRTLEDRLIECAVPYRVIGGPRFYERAEIRDANAYLRLIAQPDDDLAFERICNRPRRGFGAKSLQTLRDDAARLGVSLYQASLTATEIAPKTNAQRGLSQFVKLLQHWQMRAPDMKPHEVAAGILDESGYTAMWQEDKSLEAPGKLDNLKELIRSMGDFETLTQYLDHIALVLEAASDTQGDKVVLMTLHAAKGLEFDTVFLPGWEEGLFPHQRSLDEEGTRGLEEERRLAYVGLTRARRRVTISHAAHRNTYGKWLPSNPSSFLDELPPEYIAAQNVQRDWDSQPKSRFANQFKAQAPQEAQIIEPANIDTPPPETATHIKDGGRVFHQKFGYGHIQQIDGDKLTIRFDHAGLKKIRADFVEKLP